MQAARVPWLDATALPRVPSGAAPGSWGWVDAAGAHQTLDRAEVIDAVAADVGKQIDFAWGPDDFHRPDARMRPIYEVVPDATLGRDAAARARTKARERSSLWLSAAAIVALVLWLLSGNRLPVIVVLGVLLFGMSPFERAIDYVENGLAERLARQRPEEAARRGAGRLRYALWSGAQGRSVAGIVLAIAFGALYLLQEHIGLRQSIDAAGLVKSRLAREPYRLWTCAFLHGGVLHVLLNSYMTVVLARVLKPLIGPGRILLAFVFGALTGAALSALLLPATSVGASGGIMAFVGVLAGLGLRRPEIRGVGLHRIALRIFVLVAIAGLVGSHMIDSAAHAGGALGGVVLGVWFAPFAGDVRIQRRWSFVNVLGVVAAAAPALWTLAVLLDV